MWVAFVLGACVDGPHPGIQIGATTPTGTPYSERAPGRVWLVSWPPASSDVASASTTTIVGGDEDQQGAYVGVVPDHDGDGGEELWYGSENEDGGTRREGVTHVRFADGTEARVLARAAALVGDLTGDGVADAVFVAYNAEHQRAIAIADGEGLTPGAVVGTAGASWVVPVDRDVVLWDVAPAGDLDGDGRVDLLVTTSRYYSYADARVTLVLASDLVLGGEVVLGGPAVGGVPAMADLGYDLPNTPVGDISGDGVPDVLVADPEAATGDGWAAGVAGLFSGADLLAGDLDFAGDAVTRIEGQWLDGDEAHGEQFAEVTTVLSDLDGDGLREVAFVSDRVSGSGLSYVFTGAQLAAGGVWSSAEAWAVLPLGVRLLPAPDVDGDGTDDVLAVHSLGVGTRVEVWSGRGWPAPEVLGAVDTSALTWGSIYGAAFVRGADGALTLAIGTRDDFLVFP